MTNPTPHGQEPEALLLADQYAAAHAKWALEDLYGSSKSYTAEKLAERHAARAKLERALHTQQPASPTPPAEEPIGELVVTKTKDGQIVSVTRQDDEGRILSVIATSGPAEQQATKETSGGFHVWRDISTAPKDGSRFVATGHNYGLYSEVRHTCVAQWFRGCWMEASDWNETSELKYLTHWMPLPSPPDDVAAPAEQQAAPKTAPGEPSAHQILAITTAYEQGVGKGHQAYKSGKEIATPYDSAYGCDLAWQYGYGEGKEQAQRATKAAAQQEAQEPALFVSAKQLASLADPSHATAGSYLPARKTRAGLFTMALYTAPQLSPTAQTDSVPAIQGEMNVQLDIDSNHSTPGQQRDVARSVALGQPMGNGQDQAAGRPSAQGDKLLTVAERNIRSFLRSAQFKCESDREAALNCVDVLWAAARDPADSVQEDAARYRWLRATTNYVTSNGKRIDVRNMPEKWDAAIDAAIAAQGGK